MGITLEEIEVNASLPINPTIIRIMRVLRIARGETNEAESACVEVQGSLQERVKCWETVLGHLLISVCIALASAVCKQIKEQWRKILVRSQRAEPTDHVFLS